MAETAAPAVACRSCGNEMLYVGKLPAVGRHPAAHVFKCKACLTVRSSAAETAGMESVVALSDPLSETRKVCQMGRRSRDATP